MTDDSPSTPSSRRINSAVSDSGSVDQREIRDSYNTHIHNYPAAPEKDKARLSVQIKVGICVASVLAVLLSAVALQKPLPARSDAPLPTVQPTIPAAPPAPVTIVTNNATANPVPATPPSSPPATVTASAPPEAVQPTQVPKPVAAKELKLDLNQSAYNEGDEMTLTVQVPENGYLYIVAIEADGNCVPLYPSTLVESGAFMRAGATLHLPADLPLAADGTVEVWPMAFPKGLGSDARDATESIVAFLSPTPRHLPKQLGKLQDSSFRSRGPRPQTMQTESGLVSFEGVPQAAVHYLIRRKS